MVNPYVDIDKKIMAEIYTSNESWENLEVLCDVYGPRWPGTEKDLGSVKFMVDKYEQYGIEASYESFTIPGWKRGLATLEVTHPIKRKFSVISLPHSISGEIEAELVDLGAGHIDVYEKRKDEINGKIAMVSSATPVGMKRNPHRTEKFNRSVLAGAKGWIFMNRRPAYGPITGGVSPIIPAIGITYEDGTFLQRLVKREGKVKIRIRTTDKNLDVTTHNVIADVPGTSGEKEYVMTGSHYDGHDISQGAHDPASGVVVVLEMARVLNMVKDKLKRRIRFLCFGAEETGLWGSYNYADAHQDELSDCRFILNLDMAGGPGRKGMSFHGYPELETLLNRWSDEMNAEMPTGQRVGSHSDHWPFYLKGVPSGGGGDPTAAMGGSFAHTCYDTIDKLDRKYIRLASANYARSLYRIANADPWPVKRKTPEEIANTIDQLGLQEIIDLSSKVKQYVSQWDDLHQDTQAWLNRQSAW
ncbi:MAG: M28 family peptidase [Deltaproteobacteria bacterium]|nr:M28 family peptidase [Deltaproteobacteria bacterium]